MRNKLEYIQVIDKYLRGVLSKEDTAIFENRLITDSQLREEVAKQKLLMEGIKRNALKASAIKGRKSYKKIKTLKTIGIGLAVVAITVLSVYTFSKTETKTEVQKTTQANLGIESLDNQGFTISTLSDTVIETENGIVLAIPSDAFETEDGESVSGEINFEIKEAFDNVDIMKAGLTTTSDGELLETGEMFFLEATHKGKKLRLKQGKEILSQLPNLYPEKEMQLYDGETKEDGTINWVNPKAFEKDLITVDITSLDFYPEGYVKQVTNSTKKVLVNAVGDLPTRKMTVNEAKILGYKYPKVWTEKDILKLKLPGFTREYKETKVKNLDVNREFTDSLYYSFARLFGRRAEAVITESSVTIEDVKQMQVQKIGSKNINHVEWSFKLNKIKKNEYNLIAEANIDKGWKMSSTENTLFFTNTAITLSKSYNYESIGILEEKSVEAGKYEVVDGVEIGYFENKAFFSQRIKVKSSKGFIQGNIFFGVFDNEKVLPPKTISFALELEEGRDSLDSYSCPIPSGINPAKVKAIWNKKFNNTILATKEFEERMKVIHESHQDRILQVYVKNIDKPLWYSDSIAMITYEASTKKFRKFYEQRKGGVKVKDKLANKLSNYFNKKHTEFTSKSAKAFQEYQEKKQKLRQEFKGKQGAKIQEEVNRQFGVFVEEFETNLCEAYRQLDKKGDCKTRITTKPLVGKIKTLGPKNIDRAVFEATRDRKTLNWTDPLTGKKAVIKYEPLKVKVLNNEKFDRIFMYLVPDKLNSFNRMETKDKKEFNLPINELLNYEVKAIAYKGASAFYAEIKSIKTGSYEITLSPITDRSLKRKLRKTKKLDRV